MLVEHFSLLPVSTISPQGLKPFLLNTLYMSLYHAVFFCKVYLYYIEKIEIFIVFAKTGQTGETPSRFIRESRILPDMWVD